MPREGRGKGGARIIEPNVSEAEAYEIVGAFMFDDALDKLRATRLRGLIDMFGQVGLEVIWHSAPRSALSTLSTLTVWLHGGCRYMDTSQLTPALCQCASNSFMRCATTSS
jgi:hypothetical protein